jgi:hypothetical protein
VQKEVGDRRGNWVAALQEYDVELEPSKIIKGQGLCKLVTEGYDHSVSSDHESSEEGWENEADMMHREV